MLKKLLVISGILLPAVYFAISSAVNAAEISGTSLRETELKLCRMAEKMLFSDSFDLKVEVNKAFIAEMTNLLEQEASFDYGFDSLKKRISIQRSADNSFNIFTWYIADFKNNKAMYTESAYYYFGLIQRKYKGKDDKIHYIVIPLMELEKITPNIENQVVDNYHWFGALYYKPKYAQYIPVYEGHYYKLVPRKNQEIKEVEDDKKEVITFDPDHFDVMYSQKGGRKLSKANRLILKTHKRVKTAVKYYLLTGWNGWDHRFNYKVLDILTFDPNDSSKAIFGAPIFYFDKIPKARALFKYSDYANFGLNEEYVSHGLFGLFKKKMWVYDHIGKPNRSNALDKVWEYGPDGSFDALNYYKRWGGYFEWHRDVTVVSFEKKSAKRKHRREMQRLQKQYIKNDSLSYPSPPMLGTGESSSRKASRANKKELKRQRKEAEKRLKDAGIILKNKPK